MVDFVIVPLETIVACNYIFRNVANAIRDFWVPGVDEKTETLSTTGYNLIMDIASWPLIMKEHSRCHITIKEIHEAATKWLWRSPLFEDTRKELAPYLEVPAGFSASTLRIRDNGAIFNRSAVLLKQTTRDYYKDRNNLVCFLLCDHKNKQEYRTFLTQLMWMRDDPLVRMFKSDFEGEFQDHAKVTDTGGLSHQLESLSVTGMCINHLALFQS